MPFLKELTHLTTIIGYANNCLNPVLYVFLSESFREEYLIVLKCFHPTGIFLEHTINNANMPQNSYERGISRRPSTQFTKRQDIAMKKIKHSVAIDEIPSNYRSFSVSLQGGNDHRRYSYSSDSLRDTERNNCNNEHSTLFHKKSSIKNSNNYHQKQLVMVTLSLAPNHSPLTIIDDGGVYCGE
jgi:hypothetical protein